VSEHAEADLIAPVGVYDQRWQDDGTWAD